MDMDSIKKTGTTTVGLVCKDGVILAADKRATAGSMVVAKKTDKIQLITDKIAVTTAGTVSDIQLLIRIVRAQLKLEELRKGSEPKVKESANFMASLVYDIFPDGSLSEIDDYVSSGSGSVFAYGVLEAGYKHNLSVEEGTVLAVKSINAAMQRDTASGQGIDVIAITKDGVKKVFNKMVDYSVKV